MQKWFLSDISIKSYKMLNIAIYDVILKIWQRYGLSKISIYVQTYEQPRRNCSITHLFPSIFSFKKVCVTFVWYDKYLGRKHQKIKIVDFGSQFCLKLKINVTTKRRDSFSHAGTKFVKNMNKEIWLNSIISDEMISYCIVQYSRWKLVRFQSKMFVYFPRLSNSSKWNIQRPITTPWW